MIPCLDYQGHPAFGQYLRPQPESDAFGSVFASIDAAVESGDGADIERLSGRIDGLLSEADTIPAAFLPYLKDAFQSTIERRSDELLRRQNAMTDLSGVSAATRTGAGDIHDHGFTIFRMPKDQLAELQALIAGDVEMLRARADSAADEINFVAPTKHTEAVRVLQSFCLEQGIFDILSAYFGEPMYRVGFVIHLSRPSDTWFHVFDDLGLPPSRTIQMHLDFEFRHPKSMLYVNDIDLSNGPFSLIPKSEPWANYDSATAFRKELIYKIKAYSASLGDNVEGNTSPFRHKSARAVFGALPPTLRQTSHFGDHVVDGSELSGTLLKMEEAITGEAGTMPVFVGSHLAHRGGIVSSGERIALQIMFSPGKLKKDRRMLRSIRHGVGRLFGREQA